MMPTIMPACARAWRGRPRATALAALDARRSRPRSSTGEREQEAGAEQ